MDVKFVIENTGTVQLSDVTLSDVIRGIEENSEGQYLNRKLANAEFKVTNPDGTVVQQRNGSITLRPGATAEIVLKDVKAPDVNSTHVDDATVQGSWYDQSNWKWEKVEDTDPAHAYRLPVPLPLPSTGDAPWLIRLLVFGGLSLMMGMFFANRSVRRRD